MRTDAHHSLSSACTDHAAKLQPVGQRSQLAYDLRRICSHSMKWTPAREVMPKLRRTAGKWKLPARPDSAKRSPTWKTSSDGNTYTLNGVEGGPYTLTAQFAFFKDQASDGTNWSGRARSRSEYEEEEFNPEINAGSFRARIWHEARVVGRLQPEFILYIPLARLQSDPASWRCTPAASFRTSPTITQAT